MGAITARLGARSHSWSHSMNTNALPYALGAILLGAVGIWFHDFATAMAAGARGVSRFECSSPRRAVCC